MLEREFSLASSSVSFERDFTKLAKPGRASPLAMEGKIALNQLILSPQTFKHVACYLVTPLHLGVAVWTAWLALAGQLGEAWELTSSPTATRTTAAHNLAASYDCMMMSLSMPPETGILSIYKFILLSLVLLQQNKIYVLQLHSCDSWLLLNLVNDRFKIITTLTIAHQNFVY